MEKNKKKVKVRFKIITAYIISIILAIVIFYFIIPRLLNYAPRFY